MRCILSVYVHSQALRVACGKASIVAILMNVCSASQLSARLAGQDSGADKLAVSKDCLLCPLANVSAACLKPGVLCTMQDILPLHEHQHAHHVHDLILTI